MNFSSLVPGGARFGLFAGVLFLALPAWADSVTIDTFREAPATVYVYPLINAGAWASTQTDASILGGERELQVTPVGGSPPASSVQVVGAAGVDDGVAPQGVLQIGTQGGYSAVVELVYDGEDAEGLGGSDFTQGGTLDRLEFSFAWIAAVGSLEATVTVTDTEGRQASRDASFADNGGSHNGFVRFSDFSGDAGTSFESVDRLEIVLNTDTMPNADFGLDSISIVPEPGAWSLLAVGVLTLAAYRRRRRGARIHP